MITRLQAKTESALTPLEYNERKRENGTAEIIYTNGVASTEPNEIRRVFREYEDNPAVSARARKLGIHITVNPDEKDNTREDFIKGYIREMMGALGYGSQPYVVYRHHDIDRVHYHIVSARARLNGKIIKDSFDKRKLMSIQGRLARKYGFWVGHKESVGAGAKLEARPMEKGMSHLIRQMTANIGETMYYWHDTEVEFKVALGHFGIVMKKGTLSRKGEEYDYTSFRAVDKKGNYINRPVQDKRLLGMSFKEYYDENRRSKQKNLRVFDISLITTMIQIAFDASSDYSEFARRLSRKGIYLYAADTNGEILKRRKGIHDFFFIDSKNRIILSSGDCNLKVSQILSLAHKKKAAVEEHKKRLQPINKGPKIH